MNVARSAAELAVVPRAVAIGTFDGVHLGHRAVVRAAVDAGAAARPVVTFHPHPRTVLGNRVELLATLERRLELLEGRGRGRARRRVHDPSSRRSSRRSSRGSTCSGSAREVVVAGDGLPLRARRARATSRCCASSGSTPAQVPLVEGISSTQIRQLAHAGDVVGRGARCSAGRSRSKGRSSPATSAAARSASRPRTSRVDPDLLVPAFGIYAGAVGDRRAAISIGVNPHYGGTERRIEAYLLDWEGDLYGERLVVELWQRLRDERAFERARRDRSSQQIAARRRARRRCGAHA